MTRDTRLPHAHDAGQLLHGEFTGEQHRRQAQAAGVSEGFEGFKHVISVILVFINQLFLIYHDDGIEGKDYRVGSSKVSISPVGTTPQCGILPFDPHKDRTTKKERQTPIKPTSKKCLSTKFSDYTIG